jgi:hypothetical protein
MKLIIVPKWLDKVVQCNGLSKSHLCDAEALKPYLSKKDMLEYARLPYQCLDYFNQRYGLDLPIDEEIGPSWSQPFTATEEVDWIDRMTMNFSAKMELPQLLLGHHMPEGHHLGFDIEVFNTKDSEEVIGVFARLCQNSTCNDHNEDYQFIEELTGILYARNHSLRDLHADGVLAAYIQKLG